MSRGRGGVGRGGEGICTVLFMSHMTMPMQNAKVEENDHHEEIISSSKPLDHTQLAAAAATAVHVRLKSLLLETVSSALKVLFSSGASIN